jgi:signal transduction histidine kinase
VDLSSAGLDVAREAAKAAGVPIDYRSGDFTQLPVPDCSFDLALEAIEDVARQTLDDIDHMVGTLRDRSTIGTVEAPTGLASLDTLLAHHAATGLEVTIEESERRRPLGAAADQGVYRILQEALTNAARHGTGSARVNLDFSDVAVELTVTNPVAADRPSEASDGHGLIGMRERSNILGGSLHTERANGTFRVEARIPYQGHPT